MKKSLIALSLISVLSLSGCGGSDGGSKDPVQPPKPSVTPETIQDIANMFNVSYDLVETACNDVENFTCKSEIDSGDEQEYVSVRSNNGLIDLSQSESDLNIFNFSDIVLPPFAGITEEFKGEFDVTVTIKVDGSDIANFSEVQHVWAYDNKLYMDISKRLTEVDHTEVLKALINADSDNVKVLVNAKGMTQESKPYTETVTLHAGGKGFKSVFEIMLLKNEELFQGEPEPEPENTAPSIINVEELTNIQMYSDQETTVNVLLTDNESQESDLVFEVVNAPNFVFVDQQTRSITFKPTNEDANELPYEFGVTVSDGDLSTYVAASVTVNLTSTEPTLPTYTLSDFANLIGEPVEKLELLFTDSSYISWSITENGEPVITYNWVNTHYMEFNLGNMTASIGGHDYVESLSTYEIEGSINSVYVYDSSNGGVKNYEFEPLELKHSFYNEKKTDYVDYAYKVSLTNELVNDIFLSGDSIYASFNAVSGLSGERDELSLDASVFFMSEAHKEYLFQILTKFTM